MSSSLSTKCEWKNCTKWRGRKEMVRHHGKLICPDCQKAALAEWNNLVKEDAK